MGSQPAVPDSRVELSRTVTLLPRARQAFTLTQSSYRTGRATLLDVIDTERTLLDFERAFWRAVSNYEISIAELEALCGGGIR